MSTLRELADSAGAARTGTIVGLFKALRERVAVVAAGIILETKTTERTPAVISGWLPPKTPTHEDFPFIVVRPPKSVDSDDGADQSGSATVELMIGTYSDTDEGFIDVLIIFDALRQSLLADPILDNAFERIGEMHCDPEEQQARPQWFGTISLNFRLPRPVRIVASNSEVTP